MYDDFHYYSDFPEYEYEEWTSNRPFQPLPPSTPIGFPAPGQQPGSAPQAGGQPSYPPPPYTPQMPQAAAFAVDPGAIRGCLHRYTYIWLDSGRSFWFYPTYVGRTSVAGWRWRNSRWVYYGTDLRRIRSFQCFS
ncbi:transporter [Bacillus xiapuensis]|uniref:transporter n=1 Tax=Bacillus xiapuensis TaxID=2014075 RepID=UPI000C2439EB|nr:transporter [Bacillus xiapuensis]